MSAANGRIDDAEQELLEALRELTEAGQRARCVHPAARLAEIRILQGRFDEAEQLLAGFDDEPEAMHAGVTLRLARGDGEAAAVLIERRLRATGTNSLLAAPLLAQLVQAKLAGGDLDSAGLAVAQLSSLAVGTGRERVGAAATFARGRLLASSDDPEAIVELQQAVDLFERARLPLDAARARLELARALATPEPEVAIDLASRARTELESLGADREADAAAALLRTLGVKVRSGPRSREVLSKRETEVLRLLGEGLSNASIAKRLFISPKTVEHHVGRIYAKLGLSSRGEAAAYAVRHLGPE